MNIQDTPKDLTVFQVQLKKIFEEKEQKVIKHLIRLCLLKQSEKTQQNLVFVELFDYLGLERFVEFLSLFEEKTIRVPTLDSFQESVYICLCLYLKEFKDKSWEEIEDIIFSEEIKPKKLNRKVQNFQGFLDHTNDKIFKDLKNKVEDLGKDFIKTSL